MITAVAVGDAIRRAMAAPTIASCWPASRERE